MARIPTSDELGLATPTGVPRGARMPQIQGNLDVADTSVAQAGLAKMQERLENEELANAQTQFQIAALAEAEKLEKDQEFEGHAEKHQAAMMEQLGKASANISNGATREAFMQRGQQQLAQLNDQVRQVANKKMDDRDRGFLGNEIGEIVRGAWSLEYGDPAEAAMSIQLAVESAVERGLISEPDGDNTIRKAQLEIAEGRLAAMNATQQLGALEQPWAQHLPPGKLRQLKLKAQEELENEVAQDFAFSLVQQNIEREENGEPELSAFEANMQIYNHFKNQPNSAGLIDRARTQFNSLAQTKQASDTQTALDSYNAVDLEVRTTEPPPTAAQLLDKEGPYFAHIEKMAPAQRSNLETYVRARAEGVVLQHSDRATLYKMRQLYAAGPEKRREAVQFFLENSAKLNQTDWKQWNKELVQGEPSGLFNHQTMLQAMTDRLPAAKQADVYQGITSWYLDYQEKTGAEPTDREVQEKITQAITGVKNESIWGRIVGAEEYPHSADLDDRVANYARVMKGKKGAEAEAAGEAALAPYSETEKLQIKMGNLRRIDPEIFDELYSVYQQNDVQINFILNNYGLFERDFREEAKKKAQGLR